MTSNFVLDETLTLEVLRPTQDDAIAAFGLFEKYADQKASFTDCVSFVLMKARRIDRVLGFDKDFRGAGFHLVPGDAWSNRERVPESLGDSA